MTNLRKGLVGHWTMDDVDTSGGTIYDRSAYDNHGTLVNTPTTGVSGQVGEAYSFNGSNNYIDVKNSSELNPDNITISFWININQYRDSDGIMLKVGSERQYTIFLKNIGNINTEFHSTSSAMNIDITGLPTNEWGHLCYVWDTTTGSFSVYLNGGFVKDKSVSDPLVKTTSGIRIGSWGPGAFDGELDDIRIYDRALSESEISALYNMREQRQQNLSHPMNTTVNGKDVVLQRDAYGSWILVQNYEHLGGTNPTVSPGSTFPQLPNGLRTTKDIDNVGSNGELRHVDNISQYGNWQVDAVRLEAVTSNHSRKINYLTENQNVIDSIVDNSVDVGHTDLASSVTKYDDHTAGLPDAGGDRNSISSDSNHIFGYEFPMYGDMLGDSDNEHWAMAGKGDRWEVDDYPDNSSNTTIHRVWVRTGLFD